MKTITPLDEALIRKLFVFIQLSISWLSGFPIKKLSIYVCLGFQSHLSKTAALIFSMNVPIECFFRRGAFDWEAIKFDPCIWTMRIRKIQKAPLKTFHADLWIHVCHLLKVYFCQGDLDREFYTLMGVSDEKINYFHRCIEIFTFPKFRKVQLVLFYLEILTHFTRYLPVWLPSSTG